MSEISDNLKRRIVVELATFKTAAEVRTLLREEQGGDIPIAAISKYDASREYCGSGEALRQLFAETRRQFVTSVADIPIAHIGYRLRQLQDMAQRAKAQGNFKLAGELLEQAAKDHGGLFTNVRHVQGQVQHQQITADEARERVRRFIEAKRRERSLDGELKSEFLCAR